MENLEKLVHNMLINELLFSMGKFYETSSPAVCRKIYVCSSSKAAEIATNSTISDTAIANGKAKQT